MDEIKRWKLLTNDFNDVYESGFSNIDFSQPLVPGILSEGLITEAISKELPGAPCVIMQKELLFLHPVQIGNTITAEVEVMDMNVERNWLMEKVRCINDQGMEVIRGQISLKLL